MKSRLRVREATIGDVGTLLGLRHSMQVEIKPRSDSEMKVHDDAFPPWARQQMKKRKLFCFLVEAPNGDVAGSGCIWLREHHPSPGRGAYLEPNLISVYTKPEYRGRGAATLILKATTRWAKERGYGDIHLHASDMGRPIYERFGYKNTDEMRLRIAGPASSPSEGRPRRNAR